VLDEFFDSSNEFADAAEAATTNGLLCNETEPAFDLVEPRGVCRCVVDLEARPLGKPCAHFGMLVGSVVVDDQVHSQMGGNGTVNALQKGQKLLVAVPGLQSVNTVPVATSRAANKVVVPWRT
jgi:hypothetical protein